MNRRTLLGRFAASKSAHLPAERPNYFRAMLEPLENRQLLTVTTLNWTVDTANSAVTLALPDQNVVVGIGGTNYTVRVRLRDQAGSGSGGTWSTGNTTNFTGSIAIQYADGGTLQFMTGQSNLHQVDATNWRPNPGTQSVNPDYNPNIPDSGTSHYPFLYSNFTYTPNKHDGSGTFNDNSAAPAAFGTRLNGTITYPLIIGPLTLPTPVTADIGYLSLSQLTDDVASGVLTISGGSFASNTANLGVTGANVGLHGLSVIGVTTIPSYLIQPTGLVQGTNAAPTGAITTTGALTRKMTSPLNIPIAFLDTSLSSTALSGTISGQLVANVTLVAPTVDLNGTDPGTGFANIWTGAGPVAATGVLASAPADAILSTDTFNMAATSGVTASMATFHTGDVLAADTTGTSITQTYAGGTLTLSGTDTTANYEKVLRTITYNNTSGSPGVPTVTVKVFATDAVGLTSAETDSVITITVANLPPHVDLNGAAVGDDFTSATWNNTAPVNITDPTGVVTDPDSANLSQVLATIQSPSGGDALSATPGGGVSVSGIGTATLTLSGSASTAAYSAVLDTITFNTTTLTSRSVTINVVATDSSALSGNTAVATVPVVANSAPVVDLNGGAAGTSYTSTWNGLIPVAISDPANATVTDVDGGNLASMKVVLNSPHTGDVLAANTTGTSITATFASNTLTLSGSDTIAHYQQVLRLVTYNNTAGGPTVNQETANVTANDGTTDSAVAVATINIPPVVSLTVGAGAPNFTTNWFNSGAVPIENMAQATVTDLAGLANLASMTVTMATFHTGDVLSVPILTGITLTSSYAAGTLTLSGSETVAHYQQELRVISYNNTNNGPGATPVLASFVASDGTVSSTPVTATVNVTVASGQILGNRLFYNNSKYDVNNGAINASDDAAIASDKVGYKGTGTANFTAVSGFTRGITGVMVDIDSTLGTHSLINLTSGDVTFKVAPAFSASYNQLSTWSAAPAPAAISVRLGAGTGGSDRLEIAWANGKITDTWLEVNVKADANTGLSADDVFYFGASGANSGLGDTAALARTDASDYSVANNNLASLTTPVWNIVDYTKDGRVDISDANAVTNGLFTLRYIANPTGPFAPDGGGGAAAPSALAASSPSATPSASGAVSSGLTSLLGGSSTGLPPWLAGRLQGILSSPPVTKILQQVANNPQILNVVDQVAAKLHLNEDVLDGLLADLGL